MCTNMEILNLLTDQGAPEHHGESSGCSGKVAKSNTPADMAPESLRENVGHHRGKQSQREREIRGQRKRRPLDGSHPPSALKKKSYSLLDLKAL